MFFLYKNKNNKFDCTNSLYSVKSPHVPLEEEMGQLSKKKRAICWSIFLFVYVCYVQIGFGGGFISLEGYFIHPHMSATFKLALGGFISLEGSVIHPQRFYGGMSEIESVRRRWAKCFSIKLPCRAYILYIL